MCTRRDDGARRDDGGGWCGVAPNAVAAAFDNAILAGRAIFRDGDLSPIVDGVNNVAAGLDATGHMIMRASGAEPYDHFLMSDGSIQTPQMYDDAMSMALMMLGGPSTAETGAGEVASLANNSAKMYNLPRLKPRPFEADYPLGAPSDATGRLTTDIAGNPLGAEFVVGRTAPGAVDSALPPEALDAITEAGTGAPPSRDPPAEIGRGTLGNLLVNRTSGRPLRINLSSALSPADDVLVHSHEVGHLIDQLAGGIPTAGLMDELRPLYDRQNNPLSTNSFGPNGWTSSKRLMTPEHFGYKSEEVPREYMAEAVRGYMTDPNSFKTVAPKTAAIIRKYVNANPDLNSVIQFNVGSPYLSILRELMPQMPPLPSTPQPDAGSADGKVRLDASNDVVPPLQGGGSGSLLGYAGGVPSGAEPVQQSSLDPSQGRAVPWASGGYDDPLAGLNTPQPRGATYQPGYGYAYDPGTAAPQNYASAGSLMTGQYPPSTNVNGMDGSLPFGGPPKYLTVTHHVPNPAYLAQFGAIEPPMPDFMSILAKRFGASQVG